MASLPDTTSVAGDSANATFLGQPRGLATLFFTEMWERFNYYGMRALLVLFLVTAVQEGGFGLDDRTATAIYGLFTAAVYIVALPGGWIADRLIGAQAAVFAGGALIALGNLMLAIPATPGVFYLGLVVMILGVGLLKPNISAIVAALYPEGGARRDAGFSIFYMGINIGAFIGPIVTGLLAQSAGRRWGFLAAAVGMALGLVQFALTRKYLGDAGLHPRAHDGRVLARGFGPQWYWVIGGLAALTVLIALIWAGVIGVDAVSLSRNTAVLIVAMAVVYFAYLLFFAGLDRAERNRIWAVVVLFFASAVFWSGFEQAGSSLNLFAERFTDRTFESLGWTMPAEFLQAVNPIFIIVFAPVFSWLWVALAKRNLDPSAPVKFAFGLFLMGLGFLVMVGAANVLAAGGSPLPYWLILTYLLHTFGELALSPVGLSYVTKLAPQRFVGQMMGVWFLSISFGNLIAGIVAGEFGAENVQAFPDQFFQVFVFASVAAAVLLLIAKPVKKLMGGVN
ncbi:MAG: peptide MFS transporter [Steroidobacteraceae bacterium]|nr:peptide MFS transporter [Steroidobacteraceae bacterium]